MAEAKPNIIEPLDPEKHDRAAFSCGVEQVDNFFKRTANKLARADNLRTFVMVDTHAQLIGFYALNMHSVDYQKLPPAFGRSRPAHGSIPAAYISMIGVDAKFQNRGFGGDLLVDCLVRIAHLSEDIGTAVIVLDVLDCGDQEKVEKRKALYQTYGFECFPSQPLRLFLPTKTARKLLS